MTPVKQRNYHNPEEGEWGDCERTVWACLLDLKPGDVPHIFDQGVGGDEGFAVLDAFLAERGLCRINVLYPDTTSLGDVLRTVGYTNPNSYYILAGRSETGVNHVVICLNDQIHHDPSINNSGIIGPCDDGYYWVTFVGSNIAKENSDGTWGRKRS